MDSISRKQIRQFRLHTHHLDTSYHKDDTVAVAGACGFQNTPAGAWENALHNRIPDFKRDDMKQMLEIDKTLLQTWSFRGAPVVFPTLESDAFLPALISKQDEPWIYTRGIQLALDFLQMPMRELLELLKQVIPKLDCEIIKSKTTLDQTLAEWILPLLPSDKKDLWNKPSMYGNPDKQTVGGAVVSFLLRPCAFMGFVVFGKRAGTSPTYTSYKNWIGHPLKVKDVPEQKLVQKYLHSYGPASVAKFSEWLGCSLGQAKRMWASVKDEIEPVKISGTELYILSGDKNLLLSPPLPEREVHLLGGHDPYLGLQDREIILENKECQKQIWQTISNPGAVLWQGEIAGMWKSKKKDKKLEVQVTMWNDVKVSKKGIQDLCEEYASFQQLKLQKITV